jgi:hypothetical protein
MNFVAMSFHNISKGIDFKPDDNCASHWSQTRMGQARINFVVMATWIPTRSSSLKPWPGVEVLNFSSLKPFLLIGICVNHVSLKYYLNWNFFNWNLCKSLYVTSIFGSDCILVIFSLITCFPSLTRHSQTGSQTDKICQFFLAVSSINSVVSSQQLHNLSLQLLHPLL